MISISNDIHIHQISGSLDRGGWECRFIAMNDTDLVEAWQNIRATWRGAFGGPPGATRSAFSGWVIPERFSFDRAGSQTQLIAQTSDGILRKGWIQGCGFSERDSPIQRENYHQFTSLAARVCPTEPNEHEMRLGKLVRHILGYYDTCNDICVDARGAYSDPPYWVYGPLWVAHTNMVLHPTENPHGWVTLDNVDVVNSTTACRYAVRETNNLWNRLREIARNEFYEVVFDKNDVFWYKPHPMYGSILPGPVMTFDEKFCVTPPVVTVRDTDTLRQVKLHAVTDDGDTMHANYPVRPTHTYGNVMNISRIRCNTQSDLAMWAERKYKFENRKYSIEWKAPGLCGLLFEMLDRIQITYTGTDANGVHLDWSEKRFWIHNITVIPGDRFGGVTTFTLEEESL